MLVNVKIASALNLELPPSGARQIATQKAKHDSEYQERVGIVDGPADDLAPEVYARIQRTAKRIYKDTGDRRIRTYRLSPRDGTPYFMKANPNPEIAKSQAFATAAKHDGIDYPELLHRILTLGISRGKSRRIGGLKGKMIGHAQQRVRTEGSLAWGPRHAKPAFRFLAQVMLS